MDRRMLVIMLIIFTAFTGFGLIIPVLPSAIKQAAGPEAAELHLGAMLSLYSLVSLIASPFWGRLADRIGRRPIILVGMVGFAVSFWLLAVSGTSLGFMYASRILGGLFSGAAIASSVAYVADITSEETRTKGMGFVGMAIGLGFVFGPAIGGIGSRVFLAFPFYLAAALSLLAALFGAAALPESLPPEARGRRAAEAGGFGAVFRGPMKVLFGLSFLVTFTLAAVESTLVYFEGVKIGADEFQMGILFALIGIVGAAVQGGVVRRIPKGAEAQAAAVGFGIAALGFALITLSFNFWSAVAFVSVFAVGNALERPNVTSLITQRTPVGQGTTSGVNSAMDSLGRVLGPLFGSALYHVNIFLPYVAGALLSLLAVGLIRFGLSEAPVQRGQA
ncbi:MAG: MFS transporter [Hydrogenibacillus schlegelii]|nr:MFS transporter [Hydrogenibacillus schlegelii]